MLKMSKNQIRDLCETKSIWKYQFFYDDEEIEGLYVYERADGLLYVGNDDQSKTYTMIYLKDLMYDNGNMETVILYLEGIRANMRIVYLGIYRTEAWENSKNKEPLIGAGQSRFFHKDKLMVRSYVYGVLGCMEMFRNVLK